jgi:peptidoglycan hydrolase CwlO-like protein
MTGRRNKNIIIAFTVLFAAISILVPIQVSGKVKPITDVEDKLEGISEEEKAVLKDLFTINQKIEELETQKSTIVQKINNLEDQIKELENKIKEKQRDYDSQLALLEQVLVDYQRGGPATYLEILLKADNFSTFLKSINMIKDISHNVNKLLASLKDGKRVLQEEKVKLDKKADQLNQKEAELSENLHSNLLLQQEKQDYLDQLKENKAYYAEQLGNLEKMWAECEKLFPKLAGEITDTINQGCFTEDDLNMGFGFLNVDGYISEDTFNRVLQDNSDLKKTHFTFSENSVILTVPEEHLVLSGNFVITGACAIRFEVEEGTFFDMPLEKSSIDELMKNGPLQIDFKSISEGLITIEFTLTNVEFTEGKMAFTVKPKW